MGNKGKFTKTFSNQILTARQVFEFCQREVCGINVFFVSQKDIKDPRRSLQARVRHINTVPGTRGFHFFVPLSSNVIAAKRVSEDKDFALEFDIISSSKNRRAAKLAISNFIICLYD